MRGHWQACGSVESHESIEPKVGADFHVNPMRKQKFKASR
jgi:hypothetical protein